MGQSQLTRKAVVLAMEGVIPLFVDFDNDPQKLCARYEATSRPTFVFADQEGKVLQKFEGARDIPRLDKAVPEFARARFRDFPWEESLDKAMEKAKESGRKVGIYFADDSPDSKAFVKALGDKSLRDLRKNFLFARLPFKKDDATAKKHAVRKAVTLVLADPGKELQELDRMEGKKSLKELKAFLEKQIPAEDR